MKTINADKMTALQLLGALLTGMRTGVVEQRTVLEVSYLMHKLGDKPMPHYMGETATKLGREALDAMNHSLREVSGHKKLAEMLSNMSVKGGGDA